MPPPTTSTSKVVASRAWKSRGCISGYLIVSSSQVSTFATPKPPSASTAKLANCHTDMNNAAVRDYWNRHIHDLDISTHAAGSREFFADLDQYHFEKLHHLPRLIDFNAYRGKKVLDVGCGAGTDLVRFARGGAIVTGVDISPSAIALAKQNFAQQGLARGSARGGRRAAAVCRRRVRLRLRARRGPVHLARQGAGGRVPPRPEAGRDRGVPGLQPHLVAERPVEGDEGPARARRRAGPEALQRRRVPRPAHRFSRRPAGRGALSR